MIDFSIFSSRNQFLLKAATFIFILNSSASYADEFDTFNVVGNSSYTHDSNLFRLPSGVQPQNGSERSDNIFRNSIGFTINKQYSMQAFRGNFDHVDTKYDNAKFLDFKANNYKAAWLWSITPYLTGILSADRAVSLIPFGDQRDFVSTSAPTQNIRTRENQVFSFDYSPHNAWHLIGAYKKLDVENSRTFLPQTSFKLDSLEAGVKYLFSSGNYVSFISRKSNGENQDINNSFLVGKDFEEQQEELTAFWMVTGKSRISSNFGRIRHTDDSFSIRDFSGAFGGINYVWDITAKTKLSVGVSRTVSSYITQADSYTVSDDFFINPTWDVTPKIEVFGNFRVGRRAFEGDGPLQTDLQRKDDSTSYGVGVNWVPRSTIRMGLNVQHSDRNSSANNFDYSANTASINGQLSF